MNVILSVCRTFFVDGNKLRGSSRLPIQSYDYCSHKRGNLDREESQVYEGYHVITKELNAYIKEVIKL